MPDQPSRPHITHLLDTAQAALRDWAPVLFRYYESLVTAGFSDEQAFELCKLTQEYLFERAVAKPEENPDDTREDWKKDR